MTRTFAAYFDHDKVNELVGHALQELERDYLERKAYITDVRARRSIEARLHVLRAAWALLLEDPPL